MGATKSKEVLANSSLSKSNIAIIKEDIKTSLDESFKLNESINDSFKIFNKEKSRNKCEKEIIDADNDPGKRYLIMRCDEKKINAIAKDKRNIIPMNSKNDPWVCYNVEKIYESKGRSKKLIFVKDIEN